MEVLIRMIFVRRTGAQSPSQDGNMSQKRCEIVHRRTPVEPMRMGVICKGTSWYGRRDLSGGCRVTGIPTATLNRRLGLLYSLSGEASE
jgi:hypothetical protein